MFRCETRQIDESVKLGEALDKALGEHQNQEAQVLGTSPVSREPAPSLDQDLVHLHNLMMEKWAGANFVNTKTTSLEGQRRGAERVILHDIQSGWILAMSTISCQSCEDRERFLRLGH